MGAPDVPTPRPGAALARWWSRWHVDPSGCFPQLANRAGVRPAVSAVLPGIAALGSAPAHGGTVLVVAAANTPISAWPPILYALSTGWNVVVRASRRAPEGVRALEESIRQSCPAWAERLRVVTADDEGVSESMTSVDAVVAYGTDATLALLRREAGTRPFLEFGPASSIAVWRRGTVRDALGFWRDVLVHDQAGCLSPQAVLTSKDPVQVADTLVAAANQSANTLGIARRMDPFVVARLRDYREGMAAAGARVRGDVDFRWTVVEPPGGLIPAWDGMFGVVCVISASSRDSASRALGGLRGRISGIGFSADHDALAMGEWDWVGASRWARMGELQTPPLDWANGGVDIAQWLAVSAAALKRTIEPVGGKGRVARLQ